MARHRFIRSSHRLSILEQERHENRIVVEAPAVNYQFVSQIISALQEKPRPHTRDESYQALRRRPTSSDQANLIDLRGYKNIGQRLHRIAMAAGGWLHISDTLDFIMQSGVTSGSKRTLRSEVARWIRNHGADWEQVAIGVYRYKRCDDRDQDDGWNDRPLADSRTDWYNSSNESGATELLQDSVAPGPSESVVPQWLRQSLEQPRCTINREGPSPGERDGSGFDCRLSGTPPCRAHGAVSPLPSVSEPADCGCHRQRGLEDHLEGEAPMIAQAVNFPTAAPQELAGVDPVRAARGQRMAASVRIIADKDGWLVSSESRAGVYYRVRQDEHGYHCICPDEFRTCKHIVALWSKMDENRKVKSAPALASAPLAATVESEPSASRSAGSLEIPADLPEQPTYWQAYNCTQVNEGRLFPQLLHALCNLVPEQVSQGRGRPPIPVRDLLFGEVMREYLGFSSRRCQTAIQEAAAHGHISKPYGYNRGTDFLGLPGTTELLRALITESARPLQGIERTFAIDSSGFGTRSHHRWYDERYGVEKTRATYVKTHIMVGVQSHIITAATASVEPVGDITMLRPLLEETRSAHFTVEELAADTAYLSEPILKLLHELGIDAWIPFRKNSIFHYDGSLWDKHLACFLYHQDLFAKHYHQRSQVETVFAMIKAKYREWVRGKKATSQANGVLLKCLANNVYVLIRSIYELGIEPQFGNIGALSTAA